VGSEAGAPPLTVWPRQENAQPMADWATISSMATAGVYRAEVVRYFNVDQDDPR
jgi:hypothetical protein